MWTAIQYVGSGLTLIAFIVAVVAWVHKWQLLKTERLIKSVPKAKRAELVERTLVLFKVDTSNLTRQQQYDLALRQINEQANKSRRTFVIRLAIAALLAALTFFALPKISTPSSGSLSGEIDKTEVMTGPSGNAQLFIHLLIRNAGEATPVNQFNLKINHITSKSINYDGPFEKINERYTIPQTGGKQPIVIQPQDSIIKKTQEAIGKGGEVNGWLMRSLPMVSEGAMRQPGMRYTVSFSDASGKNYEVSYEMR